MHAWVSATDAHRSAAHSAQWQDLELIFHQLLQHGNMRASRERVVYASRKHSCMRVLGPRMQHASMYENAQTIIS